MAAEPGPTGTPHLSDCSALTLIVTSAGPACVVVRVAGELDVATADQLAATLLQQLQTGALTVRLDLGGLAFCDCAGLAALVRAHREFRAAHGNIELINLPAQVIRLLAVSGLDQTLLDPAHG